MKSINKPYWCALLLLPAGIFYLLLWLMPYTLSSHFLSGIPLSILLGLLVILWSVTLTFIYLFQLFAKPQNATDDTTR